jgi:hypothetical protein
MRPAQFRWSRDLFAGTAIDNAEADAAIRSFSGRQQIDPVAEATLNEAALAELADPRTMRRGRRAPRAAADRPAE